MHHVGCLLTVILEPVDYCYEDLYADLLVVDGGTPQVVILEVGDYLFDLGQVLLLEVLGDDGLEIATSLVPLLLAAVPQVLQNVGWELQLGADVSFQDLAAAAFDHCYCLKSNTNP